MLKIFKAVFLAQWISPRRIKNGAALRENPGNRDRGELHNPFFDGHAFIDEPLPAVLDAEKAVFVSFAAIFHNCPNCRIESRTISTASQYANLHSPSSLMQIVACYVREIQGISRFEAGDSLKGAPKKPES